ncbi:spermidine/putrescine ABC transporter substrate-binding protein [uncultured Fibrobacter sp.]|jgi:Spermidine/putrescine-binding periplasmic protein|uniref:polyamine ABC transporter substrate-binding protein n=1 Tax=uncultured Fibrobacter sp. TaxID=261512 RepID=UPI00262FBC4F|nr:spermidine/putrescine ABC transporter substrate-binding protein [uncultured Fibrobacter sp.]
MKHFLLALFIITAAALIACKEQKQEQALKPVSVMIYSEYIDPAMLDDFERKTGYKIHLELYEAQEEMIGKLLSMGPSQYDVIIASDVVIQQMLRLGLITAIDAEKVPNRKNIAVQFFNRPYDPTNTYTIPYLWGTTGILYRDKSIDPDSVSYSMLFNSSKTKGNFSFLNESRSMLALALLAIGFDANSTSQTEINKAVEHILQAKKDPHFIGFDGSVGGKEKVLSGMNWAAIVFNGDAQAAIYEDSTLQFAIPKEGSFLWVDAMTLSSNAPNPDGAYAFMNYILDVKNGAQLAQYINYATPNKASLEILDSTYKKNRIINPPHETFARMEYLKDLGEAAMMYDEAWTTVKTR